MQGVDGVRPAALVAAGAPDATAVSPAHRL